MTETWFGAIKEKFGWNPREYTTLEMPLSMKSIRMEITELRRFCLLQNLPIFKLKVEVTIHNRIPFELQHPYQKYYTLIGDVCFWATEPIKEKEAKA